ncbi:glutathione-disulfide reductase [Absidia repens]|uniref:Glutathione reductase n=1 Tax=Absidia repens TaxID=90262 RepID=A0A1X2HY80_9FUNG|nr:glutathione-disulfide reductase [Absidia repens]
MAPILPKHKEYDLVVIGGGSGGIASARPSIAESIHDATGYGFEVQPPKLDWASIKRRRDAYVKKLNGIYDTNLTKDGIEWFHGNASFIDAHTIELDFKDGSGAKKTLTTKRVLVATGGHAIFPSIPGASLGIDSDGFFDLEHQPKDVVVVGTGYIGIELAGIFHALGSHVTVVSRTTHILRPFDDVIRENLLQEMQRTGVDFCFNSHVTELVKQEGGKIQVKYDGDGQPKTLQTDTVLFAVGRAPNVDPLHLDKAGVQVNNRKEIVVDAYQKTSVDHIFALGDVCGNYELTPVAIAAGRKLMDRLYGGDKFKNVKLEYENIPTVVFGHPTCGTIGLTEDKAVEKYGQGNIKIYSSKFVNLYYGVLDYKQATAYKIIVTGAEEKVVGLHLFGKGSDEILQGFGVAIRMGATKNDFDSCVAIHPTAAEELVTMR